MVSIGLLSARIDLAKWMIMACEAMQLYELIDNYQGGAYGSGYLLGLGDGLRVSRHNDLELGAALRELYQKVVILK